MIDWFSGLKFLIFHNILLFLLQNLSSVSSVLGEGTQCSWRIFHGLDSLEIAFPFPFYGCNSNGPPVILNGPRTRTKLVPCPRETFSQVFIKDSSPSSPPLSCRKWRISQSILAVNQNPQLMQSKKIFIYLIL
jgi:hypothetical protein